MKTNSVELPSISKENVPPVRSHYLFPLAILFAMACAYMLTGAVLPLHGIWFHTALLSQIDQGFLFLTHFLFPGQGISPSVLNHTDYAPALPISWLDTFLLLGACLLLLILYLLALRYLPQRVSRRYLVLSTLLLGSICIFIPAVTSQDIFSYIIYARMGTIYHLNPLTTIPMSIMDDPVYQHLYWTNQPSAYGPTYIFITCALQWLVNFFTTSITPMVLALRLLGLTAHLWSILLIWSISGYLQRQYQAISPRSRVLATLAFAWNPLLLFEACVNAHNDTLLLLFVLLAIWFLVRTPSPSFRSYLYATFMLALATCLKVNIVLLVPGLLLFLWTRPAHFRTIPLVASLYAGIIVALYAPFWQHGSLLVVLQVNPGTYRNINTPTEFLTHLFNSIVHLLGFPLPKETGSPAESFLHLTSMATYAVIYGSLCWRATYAQDALNTPFRLVRWMAVIWFLYCLCGTPWFWPWYMVTFFGLFALVESVDAASFKHSFFGFLRLPLAVRLLAFSMLSLYCFQSWAIFTTSIPWLSQLRWAYLRGLWAWFIPLLSLLPATGLRPIRFPRLTSKSFVK